MNAHSRKCNWGCLLADIDYPRSGGFVGYLMDEHLVYCGCMRMNVRMGKVCPVFPSADFDLKQVEERYRKHART